MTTSQFTGLSIGVVLGLAFSAVLFFTIPAYHDFVVWSWTTPWLYLVAIPVGFITAVATD